MGGETGELGARGVGGKVEEGFCEAAGYGGEHGGWDVWILVVMML